MMICPSCKGTKQTGPCFVNRIGGPHAIEMLKCFTCRGAGEITDEHYERIQLGKKVRAARIAANITQREAAAAYSITMGEYSRLEAGRCHETENGKAAWERLVKQVAREDAAQSYRDVGGVL